MSKRQFLLVLSALAVSFGALMVFFFLESRAISEDMPREDRYHIQIVFKSRANPPDFWRIVEMGAEMAAKEFGVYIEVSGAELESDVDAQIALVQAAVAKKPDALILAASDYERLVPACEEAVAAGIQLVMVDSDVNSDRKKTLVATDNYELGQKLARLVDELTAPGEPFGVVGHVREVTTAVEREQGLLDNVVGGRDRLAAIAYCEGSVEYATQLAIEMLIENPGIACMVGLNESSALGVALAIQELGLSGQVKMVACDSSQEQIQFVENGTLQACVVQNPFNMGYLSVQAAVNILDGRRVEEYIRTGSVVVTKDDLYKQEYQKLLFPFTDEAA